MKTLLVLAHPRQDSLSAAVTREFAETLRSAGETFEIGDLHRERFDAVMKAEDEPDWSAKQIDCPADVRREIARIERNQALVMIFPVYWWSVPAMLKGWIDRVWTYNWAYGDVSLPVERIWMIGIAGCDASVYAKYDYDRAMKIQLDTGLLEFCGVENRRVEILFGSLDGAGGGKNVLERAGELAREFCDSG